MRLTLLLTLAALALGGCKSMSQAETVAARDDGVDRDQMARVEQAASRSGARVQWVNPPLKPAK
jgi:hypothetical protein